MFDRNDALAIASKLGATIIRKTDHDVAQFWFGGKLIGWYGIRRSLQAHHNYIPRQLSISRHQCREFLICNLNLDGLVSILQERGVIPQA